MNAARVLTTAGRTVLGLAAATMFVVASVTQYKVLRRVAALEQSVGMLSKQRPDRLAESRVSLPNGAMTLDGAPAKGSEAARIAIIEFADFQCDYCRAFARDTYPELERRYVATGKVLFAFRHLPLSHSHLGAEGAAEAAVCAGSQGKFWQMHDRLFQGPETTTQREIVRQATKIGVDMSTFENCVKNAAERVAADAAMAHDLGIQATPTFLVGMIQSDRQVKISQTVIGLQPAAAFERIVDPMLSSITGEVR